MREAIRVAIVAVLLFGVPLAIIYFTLGLTATSKETFAIVLAVVGATWLLYSKLEAVHRDVRGR